MMLLVLAALCLYMGSALAQDPLDMYTVKNYPDPIRRYQACGRVRPSFICDPTNILPEVKADTIDDELRAIYNETTVPCYANAPRATRQRGYIPMVAVMPKMERFHTLGINGEYSMDVRYMEAQYFSYFLGTEQKWGQHSSQCNEMVIILYSAEDGVLYTSTQSKSREKLTDDDVRDTVLGTLTMFYPFGQNKNRVADAIHYMVRRYGNVLRQDVAGTA